MLRSIGLILSILLMSHVTVAAPAPKAPSLAEAVDRVVEKALAEHRIVGTVIIVSRDGTLLYDKASGLADRENNRPLRKDAVFRLASMTKPLVSVAVLRLADRGLLKLDDPVTRWLPDFRPRTADGRVPVITIRQLLTHRSGLNYRFFEAPEGPYHKLGVSDGLDERSITLDENLARLSRAPLLFTPGTSWQYSLATDVLGRVIEKVTGLNLATAMGNLVTGPLAMKDTEFTASHPERLATPYADATPVPLRMPALYHLPFGLSTVDFSPARAFDKKAYPSGGGGMVGTADDYRRFLEAVRTGDPAILKPASYTAIFESSSGTTFIPVGDPGWGWGLLSAILLDPEAAKSPQHPGTIAWGGIYGTSWWVDRTAGLTVIIMTNTTIAGMAGSFPSDIKEAVYGALR